MEKINIAELLKDCPKGMELDCTIYNGKVCFEGVDDRNPACPIIKISVNLVHIERLDAWGQYSTRDYSKCVIFPKGKTTWEGFVPPCKFKDEGERIRKALISVLKSDFENDTTIHDISVGDIISWLEKQGNKPQGKSALEAIRDEKVDNANKIEPKDYSSIDPHFGKPIDKVEPKFHKGDWIVFNGLTLYVKEVVKGFYRTISKGGISNSYDWDIDKIARLWTIQDAKDGDVLAEDSCIFIIQKFGDNCTSAKTHCILYDDGDFDDGSILYFDIDSTKLATEEENQKLFDAIKENGYKWNAETKTLEKLHKFKAGDEIRSKYTGNIYTISHIDLTGYKLTDGTSFVFDSESCFELTLNKFDITTLVPLESKVLVRDCDQYEWEGEIFTRYAKSFNNSNFVTLGGESWKQCIPYNDDTKHLLGTTDDCEEYYKNWCNE